MSEDILEQLLERAEKCAFPPPQATIDDLVEAQEAMLISIPPVYREFLLECSHFVVGHLEPATVADPNAHNYLPELAAEAWAEGLPRHLVPLCKIDEGIYCVSEDDTVSLWQYGDDEASEVCDNCWYWARDIWLES